MALIQATIFVDKFSGTNIPHFSGMLEKWFSGKLYTDGGNSPTCSLGGKKPCGAWKLAERKPHRGTWVHLGNELE